MKKRKKKLWQKEFQIEESTNKETLISVSDTSEYHNGCISDTLLIIFS